MVTASKKLKEIALKARVMDFLNRCNVEILDNPSEFEITYPEDAIESLIRDIQILSEVEG